MNDQSTLSKRVLKGSFIVLLFTFLATPIGYFTRIIYSQTLSIEMFGLLYAISTFFSFIATYNDLGFGYSVSYLVPKFIKQKNYAKAWTTFIYVLIIEITTSVLLSVLLLILASWLATNYFKAEEAQKLIYIFIIFFCTSSFTNALNRFFTGLQQELYYSSMQPIKQLFILGFSVLFWLFDHPYIYYYSLAWCLSSVVVAIIYSFLLYQKNSYLIHKPAWDHQLFKTMYSYALPTLLTASLYNIVIFTDTILLTLFKGLKEVGIYNVVLPIATISGIFLSPIYNFLFPLISHLMENEKNKVQLLVETSLKLIPFIGFYFALFIILFPSTPIQLLFGQKWVGLVEIPLSIFILGNIFSLLSSFYVTLVTGMGMVKERFYVSIIIMIINIILSILLIWLYGIIGAVIANSCTYLLTVILLDHIAKKGIIVQVDSGFYLKLALFGVVTLSLIRIINYYPTGWTQYIASGIIYTFVFAIFGFYLRVLNKETIQALIPMLKFKRSNRN